MLYLLLVYAVAKQWYDDPKSKQLDANSQSIGKGANIFWPLPSGIQSVSSFKCLIQVYT